MSAVLMFSLTIIAGLSGKSLVRGVIAATFGGVVGTIGLDPESALPRHDIRLRRSGGWRPADPDDHRPAGAVRNHHPDRGIFSRRRQRQAAEAFGKDVPFENNIVTCEEWRACFRSIMRSSFIGIAIGALPGVGAIVAGFLGYAAAKRNRSAAELFGTDELEGVAAMEAANNAVIGSALDSAAGDRRARQLDRRRADRRVPDPRRTARTVDLPGSRAH